MPVIKEILGLKLVITHLAGERLSPEGRSTNWPLFAAYGFIERSVDPLNVEFPIHVFVGEDQFADHAYVCMVNVGGQRSSSVYFGVSSLTQVMMIKAGIYTSDEVERIVVKSPLQVADEIRSTGTLLLDAEEMDVVVPEETEEVAAEDEVEVE